MESSDKKKILLYFDISTFQTGNLTVFFFFVFFNRRFDKEEKFSIYII